MPYYFMRDTPLQALEQLMMSQPGQNGVRILPELCPQASVPPM